MAVSDRFKGLMERLVRFFHGEPNRRLSSANDLRYGTNGSLSINNQDDTFFDHENNNGGGVLDYVTRETGLTGPARFKWLIDNGFLPPDEPQPRNGPRRRIVATFDYYDEQGVHLFQVVKFDPKDFRQRRHDPDIEGEWKWSTAGVRQVCYRLQELIEAVAAKKLIFIVEGEKDVDRLRGCGFSATCNAGGAGKWKGEHSKPLKGADVVLIADYDLPGQEHVRKVAKALIGIASRIRVVEDLSALWPDVQIKQDISDWFDKGGGTADKLTEFIENLADQPPPSKPTKLTLGVDVGPAWLKDCLVDAKGRIIANLANVLVALRNDLSIISAFRFNEMQQDALVVQILPSAKDAKPAQPPPRVVSDDDVGRVQEWLQWNGLPRIGKDVMAQAIDMRAREDRFHPLRDWFHKIEWDGVERMGSLATVYFGANPKLHGGPTLHSNGRIDTDPATIIANGNAYLSAVSRMFLIAMVARIFQPGCKADYMLVLEGEQGVEKSRACAVLAGEYFSDHVPDIHSKDASLHLKGKWLIEIAELAAFTRTDTEPLKAFITREIERYRPPYGRNDVIEPRQCLFIGTTNRWTWIKDETGGRRFWPIKVGKIDIEALIRDRDQIFAEAFDRYNHGEHWWPDTTTEKLYFKPQQESRLEGDPWDEAIQKYVEGNDPDTGYPRHRVNPTHIARQALGFDVDAKIGRADQIRIINSLHTLGWKPGPRSGAIRWYVKDLDKVTE